MISVRPYEINQVNNVIGHIVDQHPQSNSSILESIKNSASSSASFRRMACYAINKLTAADNYVPDDIYCFIDDALMISNDGSGYADPDLWSARLYETYLCLFRHQLYNFRYRIDSSTLSAMQLSFVGGNNYFLEDPFDNRYAGDGLCFSIDRTERENWFSSPAEKIVFLRGTRTIGGNIIWPATRGGFNSKRSKQFDDRIDVALFDIKNYYSNNSYKSFENNPDSSVAKQWRKWLDMFRDFETFSDFFCLTGSFVNDDYSIPNICSSNLEALTGYPDRITETTKSCSSFIADTLLKLVKNRTKKIYVEVFNMEESTFEEKWVKSICNLDD